MTSMDTLFMDTMETYCGLGAGAPPRLACVIHVRSFGHEMYILLKYSIFKMHINICNWCSVWRSIKHISDNAGSLKMYVFN